MAKHLDATVLNTKLAKIASGIRYAMLTVDPANFGAMSKLGEATLVAASNNGVDGTSGAYTFAPGASNANGTINRKVTVAVSGQITATATGICTHQAIHDNSSVLLLVDTVGPVTQTGTAQAGAASTITLAAAASATDNIYNGYGVRITSGTGAGQDRIISGYVGATKVATVSAAWTVQPNSTSVYEVFGFAVTSGAAYSVNSFSHEEGQPT